MFEACENLSFSPDLPATTLTDNCYRYMYVNCYKLARIPSIINAEIMAPNCCYQMFMNCSKLTTIYSSDDPNGFNKNNMWDSCNGTEMFKGCTLLAGDIPYTSSITNKAGACVAGGYFTAK